MHSLTLDWRMARHFGLTLGYGLLYFRLEDDWVDSARIEKSLELGTTLHGPILGFKLFFWRHGARGASAPGLPSLARHPKTLAVLFERVALVVVVREIAADALVDPHEVILQRGPALRQHVFRQVAQQGTQSAHHLNGSGAAEPDLVEGEHDEVVPRRHGHLEAKVPRRVVAPARRPVRIGPASAGGPRSDRGPARRWSGR